MAAPADTHAECLSLLPKVSRIGETMAPLDVARVRQKIFFKLICERCGRNKRLAVCNKITGISDALEKV